MLSGSESGDGGGGRREALIVAAGRYEDQALAGLRSPSRDAAALAEVLGDAAIGGFGVRVLLDEPGHLVRERIDEFFAERRPEDLLVLYLSCHGVKDGANRLYFAASTTKLRRLASTGIAADFVYEQVDRCLARRVLLLLDCCYSGAFRKGYRPRAAGRAEVRPLERGRAVITSCTALEYSFEIDSGQVSKDPAPLSVFTSAVAEGLRTGQADRDGDGLVSVDELYSWVYDRVRGQTPEQTPEKKWGDLRGDFIIARNPHPPARPDAAGAGGPADDQRPSGASRRVLLGLAAASAAGLAITGWELTRPQAASRQPPATPKATPAATTLWTRPLTVPSGLLNRVTVTVAGDTVYVYESRNLQALRASDGKNLWDIGHMLIAAPADKGIAYTATDNALHALRARDGGQIWSSAMTNPRYLAIDRDVAYTAGLDGEVHALRLVNGAKIWTFSTFQTSPTGIAAVKGVAYAAASDGGRLYALRAGKQIWSYAGAWDGSPQISGGVIYIDGSTSAPGPAMQAIRAADGTGLWSFPAQMVLLADPVIYAVNRHLHALRASDGRHLWSFPHAAQPIPSGESLYLLSDNNIFALRASDGSQIWKHSVDNRIIAIAAANGKIYVAGSNNLYALSASDGKKIWTYPAEAWTLVAADGIVYLITNAGYLVALK